MSIIGKPETSTSQLETYITIDTGTDTVSIDGKFNVTGDVNVINGNVNFYESSVGPNNLKSTFYIDHTNHRVGVGTTSPDTQFHIDGVAPIIKNYNIANDGSNRIDFTGPGGTILEVGALDEDCFVSSKRATGNLSFDTNSTERMKILASGEIQLNTTKALVLPRLTTTERDGLTPVAGMFIYNTTTSKLNVYTSAWEAVSST